MVEKSLNHNIIFFDIFAFLNHHMKKKLLIIVFLFITTFNFAQSITNEFITGTWKVSEVLPSEMANHDKTRDLYNGFANGTFVFNENGSFKFSTTKSSKLMAMMVEMFKNTNWKLILLKNQIKVGTPKDNYSILGIQVGSKEGKVVFILLESDIYLIVEKQ